MLDACNNEEGVEWREGALPKSQLFNSSPAFLAHVQDGEGRYILVDAGERARSTAAEGDRTVLMLRVRKKYSIYHVHRRRTRRTRRSRRNNLNNYAAGIFGTIHQDASERGARARARPSRQSGLKIFSLFDFGGRLGRAGGALTLFTSRGPL